MTRAICTILGAVLCLVGLVGFIAPHFLGAHLSVAHNLVHLVSGLLSLYFGLKGTLSGAKAFCWAFGIVYGLLGIAGFLAPTGTIDMPGMMPMTDSNALKLIPGVLEFGTTDHVIHVLLGIAYCIGGFAPMRYEEITAPADKVKEKLEAGRRY